MENRRPRNERHRREARIRLRTHISSCRPFPPTQGCKRQLASHTPHTRYIAGEPQGDQNGRCLVTSNGGRHLQSSQPNETTIRLEFERSDRVTGAGEIVAPPKLASATRTCGRAYERQPCLGRAPRTRPHSTSDPMTCTERAAIASPLAPLTSSLPTSGRGQGS